MVVKRVETTKEKQDAVSVRVTVFIEEQGVPAELEVDEFEEEAIHFVAYEDKLPVGAGRLRFTGGKGKLERICVLKDYRKHGVGVLIMKKIEEEALAYGIQKLKLHAQVHALSFYEKLGYINCSQEPFMEAGIAHVEMEKVINH